jgi:Flp pilus assembly protein TadD
LAIFGTLLVASCASTPLVRTAPPPLAGADPVGIPDIDMLELTPRMERFLEHYVLGYPSSDTRRELLTLALTDRSMLGFHYNVNRTLTAKEAFDTRSGNCIAFANLFVAMARRAGLNARYHEVLLPPEWSSQDDTLIVTKHINVVVNSPRGLFQIDISGEDIEQGTHRRVLDDREAKALYFNNLAMEALFEGDLATAHAYLSEAIETAPGLSDAWSNLGVVLGRNGQREDAETAYRAALDINPSERSALGNLYGLYLAQERLEEAQSIRKQVERYRRDNPYYLLALSDEAIEQKDYEKSISLLSRAIEKKNDEHRLHFAMARTQYLSGREDEAQSSLLRARELAPDEAQENYSRPLAELVETSGNASLR